MAEDPGAAGAAADLVPVPPPSDVQGATARKAQLMADPAFRDRYLGNNAEARSEMSALNATITAASSELPASVVQQAEHLRSAGVSEEVVQQYQKGEPITEHERGLALQWRTSHLRDRAFVDKFNAGDIEARKQLATCNMLLSMPTKPAA